MGGMTLMTDSFDVSLNHFCDNIPVEVDTLSVELTTTGNDFGTPCCNDINQKNLVATCAPSISPTSSPSVTYAPSAPSQMPTKGSHSHKSGPGFYFSLFGLSEAASIGMLLGFAIGFCIFIVMIYFFILAYKQRQLLNEFKANNNTKLINEADIEDGTTGGTRGVGGGGRAQAREQRRRQNREVARSSDRSPGGGSRQSNKQQGGVDGSNRREVGAQTKSSSSSSSPPKNNQQKRRDKRRSNRDKEASSLKQSLLADDEEAAQ